MSRRVRAILIRRLILLTLLIGAIVLACRPDWRRTAQRAAGPLVERVLAFRSESRPAPALPAPSARPTPEPPAANTPAANAPEEAKPEPDPEQPEKPESSEEAAKPAESPDED